MSNLYQSTKVVKPKTIHVKPIGRSENTHVEENENKDQHENLQQELTKKLNAADDKLKQAEDEANKLLEQTRQQITKEKEQLELEKQEVFERASQKGYDEGYQLGQQKAEQNYGELINEAEKIIDLSKQEYQNKLKSAEDDIVKIALEASEKIIQTKLNEEPELFKHVVKSVIDEVSDQEEIKVYVHVNQYELLLDYKEDLLSLMNSEHALSIYPNKKLNRNDCIIETRNGQIDTSIDTKLSQLKNVLGAYEKEYMTSEY
ncbi:flagellar assembly protein FliH [Alkalibacillus haloalkaliphilus]|uniref:flagellar assembly protein FliH n=1 Tax=Alkalibacillus haloalkaliphilus TaxID=94136 RepID=UPI0029358890|nr:flagellar assembly protein FliH [Alkalibacillus haloalkaliphilus]MDV2580599.1 flagellar assembly protein FliH [Alkalibacillus haloalkaliphilus]